MYSVLCHLHKSNFLISNWLIIFLILDWIWTAITGLFYAQMQPEKSWQMIIMIFSLYSYLFSSLQYLLWSIAILLWHNHGSTDRPRIQGPSSTRRSGATFSKSQPQRSSRLAFFCSSKIILVIPFINLFVYLFIFRMLKIVLQLLLLVSYSLSDPEPEPEIPPGNLENYF